MGLYYGLRDGLVGQEMVYLGASGWTAHVVGCQIVGHHKAIVTWLDEQVGGR